MNPNIPQLLNSTLLDFKTEVSESTGEISSKKIAEHHFCKIIIYDSGTVIFKGSIHKMWNSINGIKAPNYKKTNHYKGFNGNQFIYENIIEIKEYLKILLGCSPKKMIFQNIELGVNTSHPFDPKIYLKGLLYHKNKLFEYRFNNNLAQSPHQRFIFKIYNKSYQYEMCEKTLRIELKIIKIEELKKLNIKSFHNININTLNNAKELLLNRFDEVMHYDYTINKKGLSKIQERLLENYSNPRYWINDLKPQHRDRHKKRLKDITQKHSKNIHQIIRENIVEKCVRINCNIKRTECVRINSSNIGLILTHLHGNDLLEFSN